MEQSRPSNGSVLRSTLLNTTTFSIVLGDITEEVTDAITNPANGQLWLGGGVAGAIARKGGLGIEKECKEYTRTHGQVRVGQVATSTPGRLGCRVLIHAVGPVFMKGKDNDALLRETVINTLRKADELRLQSVSLPAISSGIFGFPKERCAQVMIDSCRLYIAQQPETSLRSVRYINIDRKTAACFAAVFDRAFSSPEKL